jgi:hypothetical protein
MNFNVFKRAVAQQFAEMTKHPMFRTNTDKDHLWNLYLSSFPKGTNPVYRERTEHDCTCCKQFIRAVGNAVAIVDGRLTTLWDVRVKDEPSYEVVAASLAEYVRSRPIEDRFLHYERTAGTDKNFEQLTSGVQTWQHFFVNIPQEHFCKKGALPTTLAKTRDSKEVLLRGLKEIDLETVDTVLDLIAQKSIYRGEENKYAVQSFRTLKASFDVLKTDREREVFAWLQAQKVSEAVSRIRNHAIGTLLVDIAGGVELEDAVKSFEAKVGAANYKRPTALVSKKQIEQAKVKIEELGLTSALKRRYATRTDITANNVLFADRSTRKLETDVFDELPTKATKPKSLDKVEEVPIEDFLRNIVPKATSIEVLLENRHSSNLVSLIAPEDPTAGKLFKWDNGFSWSYVGEMADSIKERVKKAGGNVSGDLCCRLAWDYMDDLDFHMHEPGGYHIYYAYKRQKSPSGGMLDVDANGGDGMRPDPCENIFYADRKRMAEGNYRLSVHNFSRRSTGVGFQAEIEFDGQTIGIDYDKVLRNGETVPVATINYSKKDGFKIVESLPSTAVSKEVWGLKTQNYHRVNLMLLSPNHWDDRAVGNKHYFFVLDGCKNDGTARGFFNEFLGEELTPHRKVLEMVGGKMKVADSGEQLSGLGFSSTQRNSIICRVKGSFTRNVKVVF